MNDEYETVYFTSNVPKKQRFGGNRIGRSFHVHAFRSRR